MYSVAIAATLLTVLVLEMMHFVNLHLSEKSVDITLSPDKPYDIPELPERLKKENIKVDTYSIQGGKVRLSIRVKQKDYLITIRRLLDILDGFTIEEMN